MNNAATDITIKLIERANISQGMIVLDVGCGHGEVTCLLANYVGKNGKVIGVDSNENAIALAQERAAKQRIKNVSFVKGNLIPDILPEEEFDAAFARRVILYQEDAVDAISRITSAVKSGGILVFQEHDCTNGPTLAKIMPVHGKVHDWMWEMIRREEANPNMGKELFNTLSRAGLKDLDVRAEALLITPNFDANVAFILKSVWHRLVSTGVVHEEEADLETIESQLLDERKSMEQTAVWDIAYLGIGKK